MPVIRIRDPPRMQTSGGPIHLTPDELDEIDRNASQTEYYINLASAVISILALVVLSTQTRALRFNFQTWVSFIPAVRHNESMGILKHFATDIEEVCDIHNLSISTLNMQIDHKTHNSTYVVMPMAYQTEHVPAALLLIWVLAISAAFQTYRAKWMYKIQRMYNPWLGYLILLAPHCAIHIVFIFRIALLEVEGLTGLEKAAFLIVLPVTCIGIIIFPFTYTNNTPDFGLWLEYMLTAPIMIAIIAMSVWLRDRSTLIALGAAQACMLLCGVVIEGCIQTIYDTNRGGVMQNLETTPLVSNESQQDQDTEDDLHAKMFDRNVHVKTRAQHEAVATLVVAWVTFILIWFVIVTQLN